MASAQRHVQVPCRIFPWIEQHDSSLAIFVRECCLEGILAANGRVEGVTFLLPSKGVSKKICDMGFSADARKVQEASELFRAHVLPDFFGSGEAFKAKAVGNALRVLLPKVARAAGASVEFEGGLAIAKADDFTPIADRASTYAVWRVTEGAPPVSGEKYSPPHKGKPMKKFGGGSSRSAFHKLVCDAASADLGKDTGKAAFEGAFLAACVAVLSKLETAAAASAGAAGAGGGAAGYEKALAAFDCDPFVCYFILVEPFRNTCLVDEDCFDGLTLTVSGAREAFLKFHKVALGKGGKAPSIGALAKEIGGATNIAELPNAVVKKYQSAFGADADCHLWQDFFRAFGSQLAGFVRMCFSVDEAAEFKKMMGEAEKWCRCEYAEGPQTEFLDPSKLCPGGGRRHIYSILLRFINSSDFLHAPCSAENGSGSADPFNCEPYLREGYALAALKKPDNAGAMTADKASRDCLATFLSSCGSLEKAVAILSTVNSSLGLPN